MKEKWKLSVTQFKSEIVSYSSRTAEEKQIFKSQYFDVVKFAVENLTDLMVFETKWNVNLEDLSEIKKNWSDYMSYPLEIGIHTKF